MGHTIPSSSPAPDHTVISAYGLGWGFKDAVEQHEVLMGDKGVEGAEGRVFVPNYSPVLLSREKARRSTNLLFHVTGNNADALQTYQKGSHEIQKGRTWLTNGQAFVATSLEPVEGECPVAPAVRLLYDVNGEHEEERMEHAAGLYKIASKVRGRVFIPRDGELTQMIVRAPGITTWMEELEQVEKHATLQMGWTEVKKKHKPSKLDAWIGKVYVD